MGKILVTGGAGYIGSHTVRRLPTKNYTPVIYDTKRSAGKKCKVTYGARRAGDPAVLVASSEKAKNVLRWTSEFNELDKNYRNSMERGIKRK